MRPFASAAPLAALLLLGACAVGPSTRVEPMPAPAVTVTDGAVQPAARALLDSLDAVRSAEHTGAARPSDSVGRADSTARGRADTTASQLWAPSRLALDSISDLSWLDVFRDSQLVALVNEAVANNRDLRVAQARVREYRADLTVTRSNLLPQLSVNASRSTNRSAFGPLSYQYNATGITGDVSWPIDVWGGTRRQTEAARFDLGQSEEDLRDTTLSVVSNVATQYLQLLELDEDVALSEATLAAWRRTLDLARRRFEQGAISELDVRQFEADLAAPTANLAEYARQRTATENQLAQLLGRRPSEIPRGRPLSEVVRSLTVPDSIPGALIARRPDVRSAQRSLQASLAQVGVAVANRLPSITLTGEYGTQRPSYQGLFDKAGEIYTAKVGVSVPLFSWGQLRGKEQAARAEADQARAQYEQSVLTALGQASNALAGVRSYRDQMVAQATQAQALQRALEIAQRRYLSGVSSSLDVLDSQRSLFSAQLGLVQARGQYLTATVDLYRALGGGWNATPR